TKVSAGSREVVAAIAEGIARGWMGVRATTGDIRCQLEMARAGEVTEARELREAIHAGVFSLGHVCEHVLLAAALDEPDELHAQGLAPPIDPKLRERKPQLGGPAGPVLAHRCLPDGIRGVVHPAVRLERPVPPDSPRIHLEDERGPPVVAGVELDGESV